MDFFERYVERSNSLDVVRIDSRELLQEILLMAAPPAFRESPLVEGAVSHR